MNIKKTQKHILGECKQNKKTKILNKERIWRRDKQNRVCSHAALFIVLKCEQVQYPSIHPSLILHVSKDSKKGSLIIKFDTT